MTIYYTLSFYTQPTNSSATFSQYSIHRKVKFHQLFSFPPLLVPFEIPIFNLFLPFTPKLDHWHSNFHPPYQFPTDCLNVHILVNMLSILNHTFILNQTSPPAAESLNLANYNILYFIHIENDFRLNIFFELWFFTSHFSSRSIQNYSITFVTVFNSCDLFLALIVVLETTRDLCLIVIVIVFVLTFNVCSHHSSDGH